MILLIKYVNFKIFELIIRRIFMKDKTTTTIALIIGTLAFIQFVFLPIARKRSATKVVKTILNDWSQENMLSPMSYWENRDFYPNVAKLNSYKFRNQQIFKKNDVLFAKFHIDLKFAENNFMPQNSEWLFTLKKTSVGWKIIEFRISRLHQSDIVRKEAIYDATADRQMLNQMESNHVIEKQKEPVPEQQKEETKTLEPLKPIPKVTPIKTSPTEGKRPGYKSIPALIRK